MSSHAQLQHFGTFFSLALFFLKKELLLFKSSNPMQIELTLHRSTHYLAFRMVGLFSSLHNSLAYLFSYLSFSPQASWKHNSEISPPLPLSS